MATVDTEHVLVVPTQEFREIGYFQGFATDVDKYLQRLLDPQMISYRPRAEMETNPDFKQLIPYVIFQHLDANGNASVFQYTRGTGQGEARLHSKVSIGVGGHISACDHREHAAESYAEGMRRELDEEVIVQTAYQERVAGMINDDETEVGQVHLGVVHLFTVEQPEVVSREDDISESGFQSLGWLRQRRDQMESWSRICFDAMFGKDIQ